MSVFLSFIFINVINKNNLSQKSFFSFLKDSVSNIKFGLVRIIKELYFYFLVTKLMHFFPHLTAFCQSKSCSDNISLFMKNF